MASAIFFLRRAADQPPVFPAAEYLFHFISPFHAAPYFQQKEARRRAAFDFLRQHILRDLAAAPARRAPMQRFPRRRHGRQCAPVTAHAAGARFSATPTPTSASPAAATQCQLMMMRFHGKAPCTPLFAHAPTAPQQPALPAATRPQYRRAAPPSRMINSRRTNAISRRHAIPLKTKAFVISRVLASTAQRQVLGFDAAIKRRMQHYNVSLQERFRPISSQKCDTWHASLHTCRCACRLFRARPQCRQ